jgi:two-component system OmpR family response regulator
VKSAGSAIDPGGFPASMDKGEEMRVLIVEDEPNLGRQLRATLEGAGYAVDLATDGEDGH